MPKLDLGQRIAGGIEKGEPPSRFTQLSGCPFHDRCPIATEICRSERPLLRDVATGRQVACHNV